MTDQTELLEPEAEELTPDQKLRQELNALPVEELHTRLVDMAIVYGADPNGPCNDPSAAMDYLDERISYVRHGARGSQTGSFYRFDYVNENPGDWALYRAALRVHALTSQLLGETGGTFEGGFHGAGDSGNTEISTGDAFINHFLEQMVEAHVQFDWYNNDGGGGDITWHVQEDVVVINGYQNITTTEDMMAEEEF